AVASARSKVPADRPGKGVIGDGIGEELARLLLGEEITEVEPPAAPLEREARVAVPVAGRREAARARAGLAGIAGTPGREHPVAAQTPAKAPSGVSACTSACSAALPELCESPR